MEAELSNTALLWGARVLYAAVILGAGMWFAYFASGLVKRQATKYPQIDTTVGTFLALVIRYAIMALVVVAVLQKFGVQTASLVAMLGAGALAIGLALQGTLGNVASGILVALVRPYRIGDFVEVNGKEGTVVNLDLFFTEIYTLDDKRVYVPNGQAVSNPIVNHTTKGLRRCVILFGVGYEADIDKVTQVLREVMTADARAVSDPPPWFGTDSLGDFAVNISARVWTKTEDYLDYRADMLHAVKETFDREGIEIPYPHTVEISKGEIELRLPPIKPGSGAHPVDGRLPLR